jgi:hypothetical protein
MIFVRPTWQSDREGANRYIDIHLPNDFML